MPTPTNESEITSGEKNPRESSSVSGDGVGTDDEDALKTSPSSSGDGVCVGGFEGDTVGVFAEDLVGVAVAEESALVGVGVDVGVLVGAVVDVGVDVGESDCGVGVGVSVGGIGVGVRVEVGVDVGGAELAPPRETPERTMNDPVPSGYRPKVIPSPGSLKYSY